MAALARHGQALVVAPALQYATEVRDLFPCVPRPSPFAPGELAALATSADLVLFAKAGCGFCKAAKASTASLVARRNVVLLDSVAQRRALAAALGLPAVTVPVVFVQGRCGGDGEALRALLATPGMLEARLELPMEKEPFRDPDTSAWRARKLCAPPGGGGPANYFWNTYGNTVRALSAVHVGLFALALLAGVPRAALRVGAALVLADLSLFVASANASPLALACTSALWLRRGPTVPAVPYKVVFVLYVVGLYRVASGAASPSEARAAAAGALANSALLAALRFWPGSSLAAAALWPLTYGWRQLAGRRQPVAAAGAAAVEHAAADEEARAGGYSPKGEGRALLPET